MTSETRDISRTFRQVVERSNRLEAAVNREDFGSRQRTFYINAWTYIHFLSGVAVGSAYHNLDLPMDAFSYYGTTFIAHTAWEGFQAAAGLNDPTRLTGDNNLVDTVVDTVAFMAGALLYRQGVSKH